MIMDYIRRGASPATPYVSAVVAEGRLVFVSGQTPTYVRAFGSHIPARTAVGANLPGYGVEIDCIAAIN